MLMHIFKLAALSDGRENCEKGTSLASRLKLEPETDKKFRPLPGPLLQKYIAYAKTYVLPRYLFSS